MSRFYVGQRVRIVNATLPENEGREARIIGPMRTGKCRITGEVYLGWPVDVPADGCPSCTAHPDQLEPILPPPQLIAWNEACFDRDGKYRQGSHA